MTARELLSQNKEEILTLARRRGARRIRVFGSAARGTDDSASALDFLVDLEQG